MVQIIIKIKKKYFQPNLILVTCVWKGPLPGYTEGLHSLNGLYVASGRGILRTMILRKDEPSNLVPVDIVVNALIISARNRAITISDDVLYCNVTESMNKETKWMTYLNRSITIFRETPFDYSIWYPEGTIKTNYFHNLFCLIFYHYIPAVLIDLLLILLQKRTL